MTKTRSQTTAALKIIPLGGLHEIGKNTCVFEINDEILLLDAGLAFPTEAMHGVQVVLPDLTYLRENRHKIKGMIITHGHEDHIGGIPFHLQQVDIPIMYGPRLAIALLQAKLEEAGVANRTQLHPVGPRDFVRIGSSFLVEFIRNTHSIADSFTVALHTPVGLVIHTGDFKMDHTPIDGERFDLQRLAEHGEKGVLCLMSDSTNAELSGFTPSERAVIPGLDRAFSEATGRLLVTTFASSVHRVNIILQLAQKHKRKVSVLGRSMLNVIAHARTLGYVQCPDDLLQPMHVVRHLPENQVVILTTGSQGEPLSALTRIANREHREIQIRPGDTVVFSANPIPGNTIAVVNTIDKLMAQGAKVVYGKDRGIHVSGHGSQEDQKLMLALTKPKFFVPIHGEHRMLVKHSETAQSLGVPAENMVIVNNGDVIELSPDRMQVSGKVKAGIELVDTSGDGVVDGKVLKERQRLADDGVVTVAATVDTQGQLLATPEVHVRGVVTTLESGLLRRLVQETLAQTVRERWSEFAVGGTDIDWTGLREAMEAALQRLIRRELRSHPLLILLLQTTAQATEPSEEANRRTRKRRSEVAAV
ncbi:Putative hydrolase of the metallo-beta-lactamase superfamily [Gloeomargarita lithophora Alchichica-D10]|uniref:Ribonuclease J n=1 Tax=Gloeomargarita lithophora Alchichica-D10 TaxID=1188229 RepID=A0A1J0ABL3_9CYAN|nr:ribonuclease J [Gloeomargarita lithophora]APB33319.1 Putative hydrolase of the metallo-beta-lactamase superfamily [Gloeomargarita lithophora Alchichica-D10]